jgi:hypothetical protein
MSIAIAVAVALLTCHLPTTPPSTLLLLETKVVLDMDVVLRVALGVPLASIGGRRSRRPWCVGGLGCAPLLLPPYVGDIASPLSTVMQRGDREVVFGSLLSSYANCLLFMCLCWSSFSRGTLPHGRHFLC